MPNISPFTNGTRFVFVLLLKLGSAVRALHNGEITTAFLDKKHEECVGKNSIILSTHVSFVLLIPCTVADPVRVPQMGAL